MSRIRSTLPVTETDPVASAEVTAEQVRAQAAEAANAALIALSALKPTVGHLAAMPVTGTGSMTFYWADDDQGGTLYQDQTNGGAYTKVAPGAGQIAGQELAYIDVTTGNLTTTALGLANRIDAPGLIVSPTIPAGGRPVEVKFHGSVFNTVINDGVGIQIVEAAAGNANNTPIRNQTQMVSSGIAGSVEPITLSARLTPTAGQHTWKVMFNATVGGTATISAVSGQPAFLTVIGR